MLDFALHGEAPDISHIGSTWSSSLSAMNSLRPFSQKEIDSFGGAEAFFRPAWMTAHTGDERTIFSIPWSTFTYILVYRRDLIAKAGIDEAKAFDTAEDMANTLHALQAAGVKNPWAIETASTWDMIHIASSWVWGAGGAYLSADSKQVLIHKPETLAGLKDFFNLCRYLPPKTHSLTAQQCLDLFRQGKCAVTVIAADNVQSLLNREYSVPKVRNNLGTSALPGKPWVGGDNLIIWKNTLVSLTQRQASLDFVRYLTSKEVQIGLHQSAGILPTRADAFAELAFEPSILKTTLKRVFERGQAYPTFRLWGRVESELRQSFENILADLLSDSPDDVESILKTHLMPLGRRLEITFR
jgi:multiple sugar transport system substrate-binding protein